MIDCPDISLVSPDEPGNLHIFQLVILLEICHDRFQHAQLPVLEDGDWDSGLGIFESESLLTLLAGVVVGGPDGSLVSVQESGYLGITIALVFPEVFADCL